MLWLLICFLIACRIQARPRRHRYSSESFSSTIFVANIDSDLSSTTFSHSNSSEYEVQSSITEDDTLTSTIVIVGPRTRPARRFSTTDNESSSVTTKPTPESSSLWFDPSSEDSTTHSSRISPNRSRNTRVNSNLRARMDRGGRESNRLVSGVRDGLSPRAANRFIRKEERLFGANLWVVDQIRGRPFISGARQLDPSVSFISPVQKNRSAKRNQKARCDIARLLQDPRLRRQLLRLGRSLPKNSQSNNPICNRIRTKRQRMRAASSNSSSSSAYLSKRPFQRPQARNRSSSSSSTHRSRRPFQRLQTRNRSSSSPLSSDPKLSRRDRNSAGLHNDIVILPVVLPRKNKQAKRCSRKQGRLR